MNKKLIIILGAILTPLYAYSESPIEAYQKARIEFYDSIKNPKVYDFLKEAEVILTEELQVLDQEIQQSTKNNLIMQELYRIREEVTEEVYLDGQKVLVLKNISELRDRGQEFQRQAIEFITNEQATRTAKTPSKKKDSRSRMFPHPNAKTQKSLVSIPEKNITGEPPPLKISRPKGKDLTEEKISRPLGESRLVASEYPPDVTYRWFAVIFLFFIATFSLKKFLK